MTAESFVSRGTLTAMVIFREREAGGFEARNRFGRWSAVLDKEKQPVFDARLLLRDEDFFLQERFRDILLFPKSLEEDRTELLAANQKGRVYVVRFYAGVTTRLEDALAELDSRNTVSPSR